MIEEKINNSLKELEKGLKDIESARKQVEKTVSSYDGFTKTTGEYVTKLGSITTKVQELVDSIGKEYDQKVMVLEKATEEFKDSLIELKNKLKYSLIINAVSLVAIIVIAILFVLTSIS